MPSDPLTTAFRPKRPLLKLDEEVTLARGRVHEVAGPARRSFAAMLAGLTTGPVLWIAPSWEQDRPHPGGLIHFADPGRFLFAAPRRPEDLLWCMEEALRAGIVALVVADLPGAPGLTPVRRLLLAAEASGDAPLGLLLTPGQGGALGVESRWHMAPRHTADRVAWALERRRARTDPPRSWLVRREKSGLRFGPAETPEQRSS
jgi:protein ImuA